MPRRRTERLYRSNYPRHRGWAVAPDAVARVRYVRHVNTIYRRAGTLWEGRFRAAPIESESHLLTCYRYIELNPVGARMVAAPQRLSVVELRPTPKAPRTLS